MLPKVSAAALKESMQLVSDGASIREKWETIAFENTALFLCLTDISKIAMEKDPKAAEMFLRGCLITYESLRIQSEIDDLEEQWGA